MPNRAITALTEILRPEIDLPLELGEREQDVQRQPPDRRGSVERLRGRICLSNNAAERALRGVALGRKSSLFAGSERGGQRATAMYALIGTAKLNAIDPQAWLADVIARISDMAVSRLHELLPWEWNSAKTQVRQPVAAAPVLPTSSTGSVTARRVDIALSAGRRILVEGPTALLAIVARGNESNCDKTTIS